jgi:hypothetical protein
MRIGSLGKRFGILLALFVLSSRGHGQVLIALLFGEKLNTGKLEFGLTGGLNLANISDIPDAKSRAGLNLALFFNIKLNDNLYIHPEAMPKYPTGVSKLKPYSLNNASLDSLLSSGDVTRKIKNIAVPILVRYRLKGQLFAEGGPQIGLRTKAKDVFESGDLTYENDIEDNITRFDFGFALGLAQRLRKEPGAMALGIRYYFGVTDTDKFNEGSQKNNVWQINLSIPVGAGKQKQKAQANN